MNTNSSRTIPQASRHGVAHDLKLASPYQNQRANITSFRAGETQKFELNPFEVLIFEVIPKPAATAKIEAK